MASNIRQIPSGDSSGGFKAFDILAYYTYGYGSAISYSSDGMTVTNNPSINSGWRGAACYFHSSFNYFAGYNTVMVVELSYNANAYAGTARTYNANAKFSCGNTKCAYIIAEV